MSDVNVAVVFKTYEPMKDMQDYAKAVEETGAYGGGFNVAEAYPWFRSYGLETRGVFAALAAVAVATKDIRINLAITSPYVRHPSVLAAECAAVDELSNGRLVIGLGVGKVGIEYTEYDTDKMKPVPVHQESIDIIRKALRGEAYTYKGQFYESSMPAYDRAADGLRTEIPVYVGATGPYMQRLAGRTSDGMLLAGLATPEFIKYAIGNMQAGADKAGRQLPADFPVGGVILANCSKDGAKAKEATRAATGTYIVNKLRNIKNDIILSSSGLPDSAWDPFRKAIEEGTADDVRHLVTDEMQRAFTILSGTPEECVEVMQELVDSGLNMPILEVVGENKEDNLETIRLFGEEVIPKVSG